MKKGIALSAALITAALTLFSGCDKKTDESVEALKPLNEITQDVLDCGVEFADMVEVSEENFQFKYNLSDEDYEDYSLWWSGSGADADEVCIIKAKDLKKVKDAVNDRLDSKKRVCEGYVQEQYDKLCDSEVKTKGDYVYWICSNDNSKSEKVLLDDFK